MSDKAKLLQEADEAYVELRQAVAGLTEDQMRHPWLGTWGVREILIHVSGWHREMIPALTRIGRGEPPYAPGTYDDADVWNARLVEQKSGVETADVLAEMDASHRDFVTAAAALGDEHFAPGAAARDMCEGTGAGHYREHTAQILAWRREGER
jgi:hypothetical protein